MTVFRYQMRAEQGRTCVFYRGKRIGELITSHEKNGRHCYQLAVDAGPTGRRFRGRETAARALLVLHRLTTVAKREKWNRERLVIHAWRYRPEASEST